MRNSTFTSKLARRAAATVCVLSAAASQGADITFCYGDPAEEYQVYGFNKKESYDVAIRIADAIIRRGQSERILRAHAGLYRLNRRPERMDVERAEA